MTVGKKIDPIQIDLNKIIGAQNQLKFNANVNIRVFSIATVEIQQF